MTWVGICLWAQVALGDASDPAVLIQAHVARAAVLVIATPDTLEVRKMVSTARTLNPKIEIVIRTHSDEEAELLRGENLGAVFMGEHELATSITRHVIGRLKPDVHVP
jgi:CPA2 family monovalent cation:H+ antiporter-2